MRLRFLLELCIYAYTAAVLLACALMWWAGDRWWLATILLFGPRWVLALPLVGLIPLAIAFRPRCLWPLGLAAAVMLWPIMGLNVPWRTLADSPEADLRVLTFNIDRWNINEQQLAELLVELKPDLVAIQECPRHRWQVPEPWRVEQAGELLVISAHPILDKAVSYTRHTWRPPYPNGLYCVVDTPAGVVGFACIHLETPRFGLSAVLDRETVLDLEHTDTADAHLELRRQESEDMTQWLSQFIEPKIIAGDFNMPVESTIYQQYWREYRNAFNRAGAGFGYSKLTPIRGRVYGTRIDHILTDRHWHAVRCQLGPNLGSDHLPVLADVKREE